MALKFFCMYTTLLVCFFANCEAYTASEIYGSLPDEDKGHFLRYYLAKGFLDSETTDGIVYPGMNFPNDLQIPEDTVRTFEELKIEPENFPEQLLNNFTEKYNVGRTDLFYGVMRASCNVCNCNPCNKYICVPATGACIHIGDNGGVCCT